MNWFKDRNMSIALFYVVVCKRHNGGSIFKFFYDDQIISNPKLIKSYILSFYTNLYVGSIDHGFSVTTMQSFVASYIPSLVIDDEYNILIKCIDLDDGMHAIFLLMMIVLFQMALMDVFIILFEIMLVLMFVKLSNNRVE